METPNNVQLNIAVTGKGLILIGGVVYFAAKAGTKKALKQERKKNKSFASVVINSVNKAMEDKASPGQALRQTGEKVWGEVVDSANDDGDTDHPGQYDTPQVSFGTSPTTSDS